MIPDDFEHVRGWLDPGLRRDAFAAFERLPWSKLRIGDGDGSFLRAWPPSESPGRELWRAIEADLERLAGASFNKSMANLYRDGYDAMGWHADSPSTTAIVSLGATRTFAIKQRAPKGRLAALLVRRREWRVELAEGDLLVMRGRAACDYLHSVPRTDRFVGPRISLTFVGQFSS